MMDIIKNNFIIRSLKEFDLWSMLLIFSIVILGLGYGGYWGYSYYRSSIEQKAQQSQAVKILDDAMSKISYQPFKKLFGIKRALMLMDSQATFDNGFDQLKEL